MRRMILLPLFVLSLAACGKEESQQDIQQVDQALANDDLIDNDLTAIDAISGADGNMAGNVDPSTWDSDGGTVTDGAGRNDTAPAARTNSAARRQQAEERQATTQDPPVPAANPANTSEPSD